MIMLSLMYISRERLILLFFLFLIPEDSDMIFSLDEDHLENNVISDNATRTCAGNPTLSGTPVIQKPRPRSPLRIKSFTSHRRKHVRIFLLNKYIYVILYMHINLIFVLVIMGYHFLSTSAFKFMVNAKHE